MSSQAPTFKPFNLALVQLGQVGADKAGQWIPILSLWLDVTSTLEQQTSSMRKK